ncbi:MAG TPA: 50S ribosomal protein L34e [Candidatus Nanoarchaeia archaeon]|nr:50S ribosomal protein L34e [Candidatus Nanoarchaeia archaeon]
MPSGHHKSRSKRRVFRRTPKGVSKLYYRPRKPQHAQCKTCGKVLFGVPRAQTSVMRNLPKSSKRPERPYGGVLCSQCTRKLMITNARVEA